MENLRLIKKIPLSLRNEFWTAFIDAVDIELQNLNSLVEEKNTFYDIDTMDYDRLIEISELLGVLFNATINDSVDFLRREVKSIPFKIKFKGTAILYLSFFKSLSREGDLFIYSFKASSDALVRNSQSFIVDAIGHNFPDPYFHLASEDLSGFVEDVLRLDTGLSLDVENEGDIWTLDTVDSEITTNHIGLEFFIDRIITKEVRNEQDQLVDKEFLMTWEYMDFIQVNTDFSRRVKEVPHVGAQLTVFMDESMTVNPLDDEYSSPVIKMKALVTPDYFNIESFLDLSYIEFGIGSHDNLPTKEALSGEVMPTSLDLRVARNFILFDEKYDNENFLGGISEYRGQEINRFDLHDETGYLLDNEGFGAVDGYTDYFEGRLLFAPIQEGNVRILFTHQGIEREIFDDRKGDLVGDFASGTIDYNTGEYTLSTDFILNEEEIIFTGDGETTEVDYSVELDFPIQNPSLSNYNNEKVTLKYNVGNRIFLAIDDGNGNFEDTSAEGHLISGTVDYDNGDFDFVFDSPLTSGKDLVLSYSYRKIATPDASTQIKADYYFTIETIEITEAGLFDINDNMIAYSTFPPIEFNSSKNHVNIGFLIKKGDF